MIKRVNNLNVYYNNNCYQKVIHFIYQQIHYNKYNQKVIHIKYLILLSKMDRRETIGRTQHFDIFLFCFNNIIIIDFLGPRIKF